MLRVLVQNRPDSEENPGGDTVQMDWTVRFLREQGHQVDVSFELAPNLDAYDLVHLFNLTRPFETLEQAHNANRQGKPYILSSVYWDIEGEIPWNAYEFPGWLLRLLPAPVWTRLNRLRRRLTSPAQNSGASSDTQSVKQAQAEIVRGARRILPNSEAEREHLLKRITTARPDQMRVVMNGVSLPHGAENRTSPSKGDFFLCAGAIGPRKNQLNLVKAFKALPNERLLLLGKAAAGCERYHRAVRRAAGLNVEFRAPISHDKMGDILSKTKVLVQPSYIETPGLSALEAAASGIPIVVSEVAPVREYFGSIAHYCHPGSTQSIANACREAASATHRIDSAAVAQRYDWFHVLAPLGPIYAELAADIATEHAATTGKDPRAS